MAPFAPNMECARQKMGVGAALARLWLVSINPLTLAALAGRCCLMTTSTSRAKDTRQRWKPRSGSRLATISPRCDPFNGLAVTRYTCILPGTTHSQASYTSWPPFRNIFGKAVVDRNRDPSHTERAHKPFVGFGGRWHLKLDGSPCPFSEAEAATCRVIPYTIGTPSCVEQVVSCAKC